MQAVTASSWPVGTFEAAARFGGEAGMLSNGISWPDHSDDTDPIRQPEQIEPPRPGADIRAIGNKATSGPQAPHEQDDNEVPDDAPPSLGPEARVARPADELVLRCLRDLIDDWERKGGRLPYEDVTRLTTKRGLNGHQLADLLDGLAQTGITPAGLQAEAPQPPADQGDGAALDDATPADLDVLGAYLRAIGRHRLLWAEDEVRLGRLIRTGQEADSALAGMPTAQDEPRATRLLEASQAGRRAHTELVESNLRLVVSIARQSKYARSGLELIDRIQDGNLGLMRAADKFDYTLGYKFSTYATWWIRQSIERGIADRGRLIRLPVHFHDRLMRVLRMQRRLTDRYDREPTLAELAGALKMEPGHVQAVLDWAQPTRSLDSPAVKDGDLTVGDLLSAEADVDGRTDPAEVVLTADRHRMIESALDSLLDPREADIVRRRFGLGGRAEQTLDEIGKSLGLTRERIRQLQAKALEKLAKSEITHSLYEYLVDMTRRAEAAPPGGWPGSGQKKKRGAAGKRRAPVNWSNQTW